MHEVTLNRHRVSYTESMSDENKPTIILTYTVLLKNRKEQTRKRLCLSINDAVIKAREAKDNEKAIDFRYLNIDGSPIDDEVIRSKTRAAKYDLL
jgi:hypothetical protein